MSERARFDSWKEIAQHLGRDVRTVIRWEQSRGLPVHRVAGGRITRVFAYQDELDGWLRGNEPEAPPPPVIEEVEDTVARHGRPRLRLRLAGALVVVAVAGAVAAAWFASAGTRAERVVLVGKELRGVDTSGRAVWTHRYDGEPHTPLTPWSIATDFDGDSRTDFVTAVEVVRPPSSIAALGLSRFSDTGALLWSQRVDDQFRFTRGVYGPPWAASNLGVYRNAGVQRIVWTVHHFTWWPSLLLTLNDRGERLATFVNSGWIHDVRQTRDERYLLISGVTNSRRAYFYAVLNADDPSGRSPEPPGSEAECLACPRGDPITYIVFPRTDVGLQHTFPISGPTIQTFDDGRVQLHVIERPAPDAASTVYELRSPVEIERARFSDAFWEAHRGLEANGKLRHADTACPERGGLNLDVWWPGAGWKTSRVPVVR